MPRSEPTIDDIVFFPNADDEQSEMHIVDIDITDGLGSINSTTVLRYRVNGLSYYLVRNSRGVEYSSVTLAELSSVSDNGISNIFYRIYGLAMASPLGTSGNSISQTVLRVDRNDDLDTVNMKIWDDDTFYANVAAGDSEIDLDPYGLITNRCYFSPNGRDPGTVIRFVRMNVSNANGNSANVNAVEFTTGGFTYYLPHPLGDWPPGQVKGINTVTESDRAPDLTSSKEASVEENVPTTQVIYTFSAVDPEGKAITYSITGGPDAGDFKIDSGNGDLRFNESPDFEIPGDENSDNIYEVTLTAN